MLEPEWEGLFSRARACSGLSRIQRLIASQTIEGITEVSIAWGDHEPSAAERDLFDQLRSILLQAAYDLDLTDAASNDRLLAPEQRIGALLRKLNDVGTYVQARREEVAVNERDPFDGSLAKLLVPHLRLDVLHRETAEHA